MKFASLVVVGLSAAGVSAAPAWASNAYVEDIPYSGHTYGSIWNNDAMGTLHASGQLGSDQGWSNAQVSTTGASMTLTQTEAKFVLGVATRGRHDHTQWVTSFDVLCDGVAVDGGAAFSGNSDADTIVMNYFADPMYCTSVTIQVLAFNEHPSMRAGLVLTTDTPTSHHVTSCSNCDGNLCSAQSRNDETVQDGMVTSDSVPIWGCENVPADPLVWRDSSNGRILVVDFDSGNMEWEQCAVEGGDCACVGTVRYGLGDQWVGVEATGTVSCSHADYTFPYDPVKGTVKVCQCWAEVEDITGDAYNEAASGVTYSQSGDTVFKTDGAHSLKNELGSRNTWTTATESEVASSEAPSGITSDGTWDFSDGAKFSSDSGSAYTFPEQCACQLL